MQLGAGTQGLVTAAQMRAAGCDPRSPDRLVRVRRGVYATTELPPLPRHLVTGDGVSPVYVAHVRAALLSLGPTAVARGRTSAALRGWGMLVEPTRAVEIAVPHGLPRQDPPGVDLRQRRSLVAERVVVLAGTAPLPTLSAVHTALECCLARPLLEAVVLVDSALRSRQVSLPELQCAAADLSGRRDAARARTVLSLCDPGSGSVLESVQRVRMVLGDLTGFRTQAVLRTASGGGYLRVDFCFDDQRLVIEVDGHKWHPDPRLDRARDNALTALGWRVLRYSWAEVVHDSTRVLGEIRLALAASAGSLHLVAGSAGEAAVAA